jgi:Uma2 family endonuclease
MAANLKNYPRRFHTLEEYFALERVGDARYEYWDGDAFNGALAIKTPTRPPYRYPDFSAARGQPVFEEIEGIDKLVNPMLLVEVLSPAAELVDRNRKKAAYQVLTSAQEYLLVAQDAPHVTQFVRPGEAWVRHDYGDLRAVLPLASVNCQLALSEVYDGIIFS